MFQYIYLGLASLPFIIVYLLTIFHYLLSLFSIEPPFGLASSYCLHRLPVFIVFQSSSSYSLHRLTVFIVFQSSSSSSLHHRIPPGVWEYKNVLVTSILKLYNECTTHGIKVNQIQPFFKVRLEELLTDV